MTFLNPLVLFGLAAGAIPILIHLLNIRKLKIVEFSSLRFLKEMQKTRMRRLKLRQWLILLFRTLLVLFLVLAFSRPALKGSFAGLGAGQASSTVVILLDDSPSMGTRNDHGVLFDQARDAASQLLSMASSADEVYLFLLSDFYDPSARTFPVEPAAALKALGGMTVAQRTVPYSLFVARGLRTLAASHNANRELVLITDAQGTQFSLADTSTFANLQADPRIGVFVTEISPSQRANSAVSALSLESRLLSLQKPMVFRGAITNFSDRQINNMLASLYLDGTRVAQQSIDVAPHATATATFSAVAKRRGVIGASLHIEDDVLNLDNDRYLVVRIPERIAITCIGSSGTDTRFPALALGAAVDSTQTGIFAVQQTTRDRIQFTDISTQDVILLSNVRSLTSSEASRIAGEVKSGRSLMIFPGKDMDYVQFAAGLLAMLGIPAIAPADLLQLAPDRSGFVSFSTIDYKHPIFDGLFLQDPEKRRTTPLFDSPRIRTAAGLLPGTNGIPIITMTDGRPFLCEYAAGKGKVLVFAVESGTTWSDFPFKGLFAPLLHRCMMYLVSQHEGADAATVGDILRIPVRLTAEESGRGYLVRYPSTNDELVRPTQVASTGVTIFQTAPSRETGIYALMPAERSSSRLPPIQAVAVNVAAEESDLSRVDNNTLAAFWNRTGIPADRIRQIDTPTDVLRVVKESRFGVELWRSCLALALACALIEMALSRVGKTNISREEHA
jgi:hypothetical protein